MTYRIEEARPHHLRLLEPVLRTEDRLELEATGFSPMRCLWRSWKGAVIRQAAFVDDEIACVWGVGGSLLGGHGSPWLLTSPAIERASLAFVREARGEVARMLDIFPVLANFVPARYLKATRFLTLLGFTLDDPVPLGPKGEMFHPFTMRRA